MRWDLDVAWCSHRSHRRHLFNWKMDPTYPTEGNTCTACIQNHIRETGDIWGHCKKRGGPYLAFHSLTSFWALISFPTLRVVLICSTSSILPASCFKGHPPRLAPNSELLYMCANKSGCPYNKTVNVSGTLAAHSAKSSLFLQLTGVSPVRKCNFCALITCSFSDGVSCNTWQELLRVGTHLKNNWNEMILDPTRRHAQNQPKCRTS